MKLLIMKQWLFHWRHAQQISLTQMLSLMCENEYILDRKERGLYPISFQHPHDIGNWKTILYGSAKLARVISLELVILKIDTVGY